MRRGVPPESGLIALLDALEQDIVVAPASELREAQRLTGRAWDTSCHEVRAVLEHATVLAEGKVGTTVVVGREAPATKHSH